MESVWVGVLGDGEWGGQAANERVLSTSWVGSWCSWKTKRRREREIGDDEEKEWRECVWREETLTRETQSGGLGLLSVSVAPSISWTPTVCPGCWPCQSLSRSSRRARFPHACSHAAIAAALTERTTATILSRPRPPTGRAQLAPRYLPRPLLRLGRRRVGDGRRRLLARMLLLCSWLRLLRSCLSPARGTACIASERGLAKNGRASSRAYCERETFFAMCAALTADLRSPFCSPGVGQAERSAHQATRLTQHVPLRRPQKHTRTPTQPSTGSRVCLNVLSELEHVAPPSTR